MRSRGLLTCLCITGSLLGAGVSSAQENESSPLTWSGTTALTGQSSTRQGTDQTLPPSFARWTLSSTLTTYGVPLSVNALISSENKYTPYGVNYFNIGLNQQDLQMQIRRKIDDRIRALEAQARGTAEQSVSSWEDTLRQSAAGELPVMNASTSLERLRALQELKDSDLQDRMEELQHMGLATAMQGFTTLFPRFMLGKSFPSYSTLTLDGVPLTGVDMEFAPGQFAFEFSGGSVQDAEQGSLLPGGLAFSAFRRSLFAGRLGMGRPDESHFRITALYARDDEGSLTRDSANQGVTPESNHVYGTSGRLLLLDDRLDLSGEVAVSVLTRDVESEVGDAGGIPSWITKLARTNGTSVFDHAFAFRAAYAFPASGTKLIGSVRRVGPGYASLGVPFLRKDVIRYEGRAEQNLINRQLSLAAYYRRDEDNLSGTGRGTTVMDAFGAQMALNFRNLPYLRLNYAPMSQQSQRTTDSLKIENNIQLFSAMTGYVFQTDAGLVSATNISFILQQAKTLGAAGTYRSRNAMFMQTFGFAIPLTVSAVASVLETNVETSSITIISLDLSASYTLFGEWTNTLGATLARDAVRKNSFFVSSSFPLWNLATLSLGVERTIFQDYSGGNDDYNETVGRLILSRSW